MKYVDLFKKKFCEKCESRFWGKGVSDVRDADDS